MSIRVLINRNQNSGRTLQVMMTKKIRIRKIIVKNKKTDETVDDGETFRKNIKKTKEMLMKTAENYSNIEDEEVDGKGN